MSIVSLENRVVPKSQNVKGLSKEGKLSILGSTGSIGCQTLDIIRRNPELTVTALAANKNVELLYKQVQEFKPEFVAVGDSQAFDSIKVKLKNITDCDCGPGAVSLAASLSSINTVVAAMTGFSCLEPVVSAISAGKDIALANKEVLVAAGSLIKVLLSDSSSRIIPLDSEHNALFQCLMGRGLRGVSKLTITASGGPFREYSLEQLRAVTPEQAVKHPRWEMGQKISIDSATLMNKGLEVIETAMLFGIDAKQISVLIHPQSIVHGIVEYREGSSVALMYNPDMRIPICFALDLLHNSSTSQPYESGASLLDLCSGEQRLDFSTPDILRFEALQLAFQALKAGGTMPAVLNAANEIAVERFISKDIGFLDIARVVSAIMRRHKAQPVETIEQITSVDALARELASNIIEEKAF